MNLFLQFSDAAKFADIARNLISGFGYGSSFSFWSSNIFELIKNKIFSSPWTPPVMSFSIAAFFKMFGVNDFAVVATSFFYFLLLLIFTILLGKRIFKSNLVGILSALAVGFNKAIINYATSGALESPFLFEIVASAYFLTLRKRWATVVGFVLLVLMYFTRPQAFIYIAGLILFYLLSRFKAKKAILYFLAVMAIGLLVDWIILTPLTGKYFLYPITGRGINTISQHASGIAVSDALRGNFVTSVGLLSIFKKIFYNLYNFYRLMPQIMSPYLFGLFVIGLFRWIKDKTYNSLKIATIFMVIVTLLVTALSIPFFRYLHPVVPLVYIFAVETLVWIVGKVISDWSFVASGKLKSLLTVHRSLTTIVVSTFLILVFVVGQTLGVIFLDSRFERNTHNVGKPPVYVVLSRILKDNTMPDQTIVTNLDTWGSWYGERKTIWYPLKPDMLISPDNQKNPFDAIFLTSYLMDDENYYMGPEWRQVFENPEKIQEKFISENYKLKEIYSISADEDFEKQPARAVLLIKK